MGFVSFKCSPLRKTMTNCNDDKAYYMFVGFLIGCLVTALIAIFTTL